jgi:hypothetical protein
MKEVKSIKCKKIENYLQNEAVCMCVLLTPPYELVVVVISIVWSGGICNSYIVTLSGNIQKLVGLTKTVLHVADLL